VVKFCTEQGGRSTNFYIKQAMGHVARWGQE